MLDFYTLTYSRTIHHGTRSDSLYNLPHLHLGIHVLTLYRMSVRLSKLELVLTIELKTTCNHTVSHFLASYTPLPDIRFFNSAFPTIYYETL